MSGAGEMSRKTGYRQELASLHTAVRAAREELAALLSGRFASAAATSASGRRLRQTTGQVKSKTVPVRINIFLDRR
jgi:hypothetical protein